MSLASQIHVNTRYTRSINVERDRGSPSIVDAYLPTARSIDLLEGVASAFGRTDQPRAWSLIGPYGSGKSSFALFLHELLGPPGSAKKAAGRTLAAESPALARRFARQDPWCRVVLTGSEEPLAARLLAALDEAATRFWGGKRGRKPAVVEELRRARRYRDLADSELLRLVDSLQGAVERNGAGGLLIVIDELGKFLEHEARQGGGGIYLLQQRRQCQGEPTIAQLWQSVVHTIREPSSRRGCLGDLSRVRDLKQRPVAGEISRRTRGPTSRMPRYSQSSSSERGRQGLVRRHPVTVAADIDEAAVALQPDDERRSHGLVAAHSAPSRPLVGREHGRPRARGRALINWGENSAPSRLAVVAELVDQHRRRVRRQAQAPLRLPAAPLCQ